MLSEDELRKALLELAQQPEISEKETLEVRALVRRSISRHFNSNDDGDSIPKNSGLPVISDNEEDQSSQEKPSGKKRPPRGTDK
jgi:hypothetical protein